MEIVRVRKNEKVVARFEKENSKPAGFSLAPHFKFLTMMVLRSKEEVEYMPP